MPVDRRENLIPANLRSKEEVRKNSSKGGIKSGEVRREKKRISQMYADMLAEDFEIEVDGVKTKLEGKAFLRYVAGKILERTDSASVSMLKEIREATEGNKVELSGEVDQSITVRFVDAEPKE
jgi:antitoxin component of MazEF toxin-antitoxin module